MGMRMGGPAASVGVRCVVSDVSGVAVVHRAPYSIAAYKPGSGAPSAPPCLYMQKVAQLRADSNRPHQPPTRDKGRWALGASKNKPRWVGAFWRALYMQGLKCAWAVFAHLCADVACARW
jgi:hypothetical protein